MTEPFFPSAKEPLVKVGTTQGGTAATPTPLPALLVEGPAVSSNDVEPLAQEPVRTAQLSALGVTGPSGPQKKERK